LESHGMASSIRQAVGGGVVQRFREGDVTARSVA